MVTTRKEQAKLTRQKILDAAGVLIREEGMHALSSLKIVQKAGVSKGTFFHHFPQIEDLYLFMLDGLIQSMDEVISPKKFVDLEAFLHASTTFTIGMLEEAPEHISSIFYFLSQCRHKQEYQLKLKAFLEATFKRWANDMGHLFPASFSEAKKDHILRLLDMYFCGFSFHYLILQDKERYLEISNEFTQMLVALMKAE